MRPFCKHNLTDDGHDPAPMVKDGKEKDTGTLKWRCATQNRATLKKRYARQALDLKARYHLKVAAGICVRVGCEQRSGGTVYCLKHKMAALLSRQRGAGKNYRALLPENIEQERNTEAVQMTAVNRRPN